MGHFKPTFILYFVESKKVERVSPSHLVYRWLGDIWIEQATGVASLAGIHAANLELTVILTKTDMMKCRKVGKAEVIATLYLAKLSDR